MGCTDVRDTLTSCEQNIIILAINFSSKRSGFWCVWKLIPVGVCRIPSYCSISMREAIFVQLYLTFNEQVIPRSRGSILLGLQIAVHCYAQQFFIPRTIHVQNHQK